MWLPPLTRHIAPILVTLMAVCVAPGGSAAGAESDAPADPFVELGFMRANSAHRTALEAETSDPFNERARRLALGLALMNRQPRTTSNLDAALAEFEALVDAAPSDEVAVFARYFTARLWQMHAEPAEPAKARQLYLALARDHPAHPLGQYAWVKIGTMDLYLDRTVPPVKRIARVEDFLPKLKDPAVRRSLRHVLGQACQVLINDPARALVHYEAALADDIAKDNLLSDVLLRAAECARRTGDMAKARGYYETYLKRYPRSHASQLASEILSSLP